MKSKKQYIVVIHYCTTTDSYYIHILLSGTRNLFFNLSNFPKKRITPGVLLKSERINSVEELKEKALDIKSDYRKRLSSFLIVRQIERITNLKYLTYYIVTFDV